MSETCLLLHSLADIADSLGVSVRTVETWIADKSLRAVNVSRNAKSKKPRLRVLQHDLDAFLAARSTNVASERQPRRARRIEAVEQFV